MVSELQLKTSEDFPGQQPFVGAAASARVASTALLLKVVEIHRLSEALLALFP